MEGVFYCKPNFDFFAKSGNRNGEKCNNSSYCKSSDEPPQHVVISYLRTGWLDKHPMYAVAMYNQELIKEKSLLKANKEEFRNGLIINMMVAESLLRRRLKGICYQRLEVE